MQENDHLRFEAARFLKQGQNDWSQVALSNNSATKDESVTEAIPLAAATNSIPRLAFGRTGVESFGDHALGGAHIGVKVNKGYHIIFTRRWMLRPHSG